MNPADVRDDQPTELATSLALSERRRRDAQRLSGVGFWELNHKAQTLYWSEEIFAIYSLEAGTIEPNYETFVRLIHDDDREQVKAAYLDSVESHQEYNIRYRIKAGESIRWIEARGVTYYDSAGNPERSIGTAQDISEIIEAQDAIERLASHDALTGLPNRSLLADRLDQAIAHARRTSQLLAVCYLDLDGFKPINDNFGHATGDLLLIAFANRVKQELREGDTLARLGGDEFVITLNGLSSSMQCEQILQRLMRIMSEPYFVEGLSLKVSASIGVTIYPLDAADADSLLRHADHAMYKAKKRGKSTFELHDHTQNLKVRTTRAALTRFEASLKNNELVLLYQPRIDLRNGHPAGFEALVRWPLPRNGLALPAQFLPLIETRELAISLDRWVVKSAIEQHLAWRSNQIIVPISINLSPEMIQDATFPAYLAELLSDCPDDVPEFIEFEILETGALGDTDETGKTMYACIDQGVKFSLDDFGTGYSSLTYFHRLPIDLLKIDRTFVCKMLDDPRDQDIVEGVTRLADALGRPVVAEGVESIELAIMLLQMGCQYAQGYGIAMPMPPDRVPSWLKQWRHNQDWHRLGDMQNGPTARYDLNVAILSHRLWMDKLSRFCKTASDSLAPEIDVRQRQFARWYQGIGAARYHNRATFGAIDLLHKEIHGAAQTLRSKIRDLSPEARQVELNKISQKGDELTSLIIELASQ
ncbi:EAL domain-containing protein [Thiorhodococcus mannitoliphagus]|uniref:EAL domain-containing protein n=1 Tax=Thiorhodococcus mannitoliphagus TaxID=329406 RepID=A0A6P1DW35_9GAMM|nr:EAL domain-containing protein [Thiorhodococcus mannitoliphagus]NEX19894.1 EAL domain-containing protein [Thiorhodococcus mannitoliphagus]